MRSYFFQMGSWVCYQRPTYAWLYYADHRECLLTGKKEKCCFKKDIFHTPLIERKKNHYRVIHLFYELGYHLIGVDELDTNQILFIDILYTEKKERVEQPGGHKPLLWKLKAGISYEKYFEAYQWAKAHLYQGDCYQLNLTFPFEYDVNGGDFVKALLSMEKKTGAMGHFTVIPQKSEIYFSNSPEILFSARPQGRSTFLECFPIKGTITDREPLNKLLSSSKNLSELDMITDLMRNDLNSIKPCVQVIHRQRALKVPGLWHQYSHLRLQVFRKLYLSEVLQKLFPGGSITGAPKKRVMKILYDLETCPRGFYTGSTLLFHQKGCEASINIRSGHYSFAEGRAKIYAGGGITHRSDCGEEYREMLAKRDSLLEALEVDKSYTVDHIQINSYTSKLYRNLI